MQCVNSFVRPESGRKQAVRCISLLSAMSREMSQNQAQDLSLWKSEDLVQQQKDSESSLGNLGVNGLEG